MINVRIENAHRTTLKPTRKTQGESIEELEENLRDIFKELAGGHIPCVRRESKLGHLIIGVPSKARRILTGGSPFMVEAGAM